MAYGLSTRSAVGFWYGGTQSALPSEPRGTHQMNTFKNQTFRIVMFLSVLASSSLVLMAGRRWGP
jgi:hypothetical protein